VATAEERLKIIVEAQDKASATMRGIERQTDSLVDGMRLLQNIMTFSVAGIGIRELGRFSMEMARLGAETERIGNAFAGLSEQRLGTAALDSLTQLREAARGAISDYDLMLAANKAMMLGVTDDVETMARLVEVAIERGRAMGVGAQQAFGDIITGIGRMSPLILDNLGIVTGGARAFDEYAASLGKTAAQLTDVERKQMLVNKVLAEAGAGAVPDAMAGFEALDAQIENQKRSWAGLFTDMFAPGAAAVADWLNTLNQGVGVMEPYTQALQDLKAHMPAGEYQELRDRVYQVNRAYESGQLSLEEFDDALANLIPGVRDSFTDLMNQATALEMVSLKAYMAANGVRDLVAASAGLTGKFLAGVIEGAEALTAITSKGAQGAARDWFFGPLPDEAKVVFLKNEMKEMIPLSEEWYDQQAEIGSLEAGIAKRREQDAERLADAQFGLQMAQGDEAERLDLLRQKLAGLTEGSVEYYQVATQIASLEKSMAKSGAKLYDKSAAELRSLAESLLRPTDVSYLDMAQTKLGAYTDKWDEYARRVRAAGQDAGSQWRNLVPVEILQQGEDAIRAWAAAEEQAFYSGQRPEEVNWESFIANARAEVERQLAKENLVNEAMQRLADAGIGGVSRADVARQFGVVDTSAVASDTASQVVQGIKAVDTGKEFTDAFAEQFRAQETRWVEFGSLSVTWFGVGIKNGVAAGAGDVLIDAILPRIQEKLQGRP